MNPLIGQRLMMLGAMAMVLTRIVIGTELPTATAVRAAQPPKLDGVLDEAFWKDAPAQGDFYLFNGKGQRSKDTEFKLAYDDAWLYIGVDCRNKDMKALQPKVKGHDQGACNDDSVEFFLDPGTGGHVYFHYMLGFANARDERRVTDRNREIEWDEAWRSATSVRADGWSAEIAIPLYIAASYGPFETWRLNVARNQRVPTIDAQGVAVTERRDILSWAPVAADFHEPESFGRLAGITGISLKLPFLARIEKAVIQPMESKDGRLQYGVDVRLKGQNATPGEVELTILDNPVSGAPGKVASKVQLAGSDPKTVRVDVPMTSAAERKVTALLMDALTGEEWDRADIADLSALNVMTAYLDRNYYTTEEQAHVVCAIGLPDLKGMALVARDAQNKELARAAEARPSCKVAIPLGKLTPGTHTVKLELCQKDGAPLFTVPLALVKRAPKPGCEWKIDRENRWVLNNGQPFFALGVFMSLTKPDNDQAFRRLADNRFNTFQVWNRADAAGHAAYQKKAAEYNLYVAALPEYGTIQPLPADVLTNYTADVAARVKETVTGDSLNEIKDLGFLKPPLPPGDRNAIAAAYYECNITNLTRAIDAVKNFTNLQSYFILDEPVKKEYLDQCKIGQAFYALIQKTDGYHPVTVNYSSYIPEGDDYVNWMDILETDPYWSPAVTAMGVRATPNFISKITWLTSRRAEKNRQAVWTVATGPRWSGTRKRALSGDELRVQAYLAVIHGSSGLMYFDYSGLRSNHWAVLCQLNREIEELTPALFGTPVSATLRYKKALVENKDRKPEYAEVAFNPEKELYPDVQVRLVRKTTGEYVLLAANSRYHPVEVTYSLSGLVGRAEDIFAKKTLKTDKTSFSDRLEPCATRAYQMKLTPEAGPGPIAVEIAMLVKQSEVPPPETSWPDNYRKGKKNLLPNPSFENSSEGVPDYCPLLSAGVSVDDTQALYGKKSLRIKHEKDSGRTFEFVMAYCRPQTKKPNNYVFSVYMKGNTEGQEAWVRGMLMNVDKTYGENASFKLTKEWKRYWITGVMPAMLNESRSFFEIRLMSEGTIWADGMQLEVGNQPTAYDEDANQETTE